MPGQTEQTLEQFHEQLRKLNSNKVAEFLQEINHNEVIIQLSESSVLHLNVLDAYMSSILRNNLSSQQLREFRLQILKLTSIILNLNDNQRHDFYLKMGLRDTPEATLNLFDETDASSLIEVVEQEVLRLGIEQSQENIDDRQDWKEKGKGRRQRAADSSAAASSNSSNTAGSQPQPEPEPAPEPSPQELQQQEYNSVLKDMEKYTLFDDEQELLTSIKDLLLSQPKKEAITSKDIITLIDALRNAENIAQYNEMVGDVINKFEDLDIMSTENEVAAVFVQAIDSFKPKTEQEKNQAIRELTENQKKNFDLKAIEKEAKPRFAAINRLAEYFTFNPHYNVAHKESMQTVRKRFDQLEGEINDIINGIDAEIAVYERIRLNTPVEKVQSHQVIDSFVNPLKEKKAPYITAKENVLKLKEVVNPERNQRPRSKAIVGMNVTVTIGEEAQPGSAAHNTGSQATLQTDPQEQFDTVWAIDEVKPNLKRTFETTSGSGTSATTGKFSESFGKEKDGKVPFKLTVDQFPSGANQKAKVEFAMLFASQALADLEKAPTKDKPLYLYGENKEAVKYIWTAMMVLGEKSKTKKFGADAIKTLTDKKEFDPANEKGYFGRFGKNSLHDTVFKSNNVVCEQFIKSHNEFEQHKGIIESKVEVIQSAFNPNKPDMAKKYRDQIKTVKETAEAEKEENEHGRGLNP